MCSNCNQGSSPKPRSNIGILTEGLHEISPETKSNYIDQEAGKEACSSAHTKKKNQYKEHDSI